MRKILAILFLSLFAFNGAGFYVYYVLQLQQIKMAMREALKQTPDHQLAVLRFSPEHFEEAKVEEHELKINGRMFDIARIKKAVDVILVYGLFDDKEDNLLAIIGDVMSKPVNKNSLPSQIFTFISLLYIVPGQTLDINNPFCHVNHFIDYRFSVSSCFLKILSPPPWCF